VKRLNRFAVRAEAQLFYPLAHDLVSTFAGFPALFELHAGNFSKIDGVSDGNAIGTEEEARVLADGEVS